MNTPFACRAKRMLLCAATGLVTALPTAVSAQTSLRPMSAAPHGSAAPALLHQPSPSSRTSLWTKLKESAASLFSGESGRSNQARRRPSVRTPRVVHSYATQPANRRGSVRAAGQDDSGPGGTDNGEPPSPVLRRLQELYARDGRRMPPMNMQTLPNTAPQPYQPQLHVTPRKKPSLLERIFPFVRRSSSSRASRRSVHPRSPGLFGSTASSRRAPYSSTGRKPYSSSGPKPYSRTQTHGPHMAGSTRRPAPTRSALLPVPPAPVSPARPESAAQPPIATAAKSPPEDQLPETAFVPPASAGDVLDNPFPEVSEAEADQQSDSSAERDASQETPFTGMKLAEDKPDEATSEIAIIPNGAAENASVGRGSGRPASPSPQPSAARQASAEQPPAQSAAEKMRRIAARKGLTGLKGFCPVVLRDKRDLIDSDPQFSSQFDGQTYYFSSADAKAAFDAEPAKYAPVHGGRDVISLAGGEEEIEGSLDYAVWFKDRLYLFHNKDSMREFVLDPGKYAVMK